MNEEKSLNDIMIGVFRARGPGRVNKHGQFIPKWLEEWHKSHPEPMLNVFNSIIEQVSAKQNVES